MLILSRRMGESLFIGDDIVVTVLANKSGQVRIGITAPDDVAVYREEIYARIAAGIDRDGRQIPSSANGSVKRPRLSLPDSREEL